MAPLPELKLRRRKNRSRTILPTDRLVALLEPTSEKHYALLITKSCTKAVFNYVVQSLFNTSSSSPMYSFLTRHNCRDLAISDREGKIVDFAKLKDGKEYEVSFEEKEIENEFDYFQKQIGDWEQFTAKDILVFTFDELLKLKQEGACEKIDKYLSEVLRSGRGLRKEQMRLTVNLKEKAKDLNLRITEETNVVEESLETHKNLVEITTDTKEILETHMKTLVELEENAKEKAERLNSELDRIVNDLESTEFGSEGRSPTPFDESEDEEDEQDESADYYAEESPEVLEEEKLEALHKKSWGSPAKQVSDTPYEENSFSPIKISQIDETFDRDRPLSFGEHCYIHRKKERMKRWLLLGEEGVLRISQSQEFSSPETYRLKNVIKMGYADRLEEFDKTADPALCFTLRFSAVVLNLECSSKAQAAQLIPQLANATKHYNPNAIVPTKDGITLKMKAIEGKSLIFQRLTKV